MAEVHWKNLQRTYNRSSRPAVAKLDSQQSRIVELRFFGGLTIDELAEVLKISPATVSREWAMAKMWLHRELTNA